MVGLKDLVLATSLTATTLTGISGCSNEFIEKYIFLDSNAGESDRGDFFACNYWLDDHNDGEYYREECEGIKDSFRANEEIAFVAEISDQKGSTLIGTVFNGSGQVVRQEEFNIKSNSTVRIIEFDRGELYGLGGAGEYTVKWRIRGHLIGITNINLIK